ncbi:MAG: HNH endonuclease, partial [Hyphomicrobiaceae bacterium]
MRRMLATTDIAGLKGWLQNSGIEILDSNNPYEVLRYKFGDSIVSVFVNKRGSLTWISPAQQHYHDYRAGQPAPVVRARRLNRGERQYLLNVLLARDGDNCFFCGFRMIERITEADDQMTIEHLVPRSQVGHDRAENCCLAHSACNSFMGDRSLVEKLKLRDDLGEHFVRETHLRD